MGHCRAAAAGPVVWRWCRPGGCVECMRGPTVGGWLAGAGFRQPFCSRHVVTGVLLASMHSPCLNSIPSPPSAAAAAAGGSHGWRLPHAAQHHCQHGRHPAQDAAVCPHGRPHPQQLQDTWGQPGAAAGLPQEAAGTGGAQRMHSSRYGGGGGARGAGVWQHCRMLPSMLVAFFGKLLGAGLHQLQVNACVLCFASAVVV